MNAEILYVVHILLPTPWNADPLPSLQTSSTEGGSVNGDWVDMYVPARIYSV